MAFSPLRIALVGCGAIAPTHAEALAGLPPGEAELAACADVVPERAAAFAERFGCRAAPYDALLADPAIDAVTVCVPSGLHGIIGEQALRAGKHVIVEKPMEITRSACDRLLAAQYDFGGTLAVISQHRFDPASILVKQALESQELGQIFSVDARIPWFRTQEYYDSGEWRGTWGMDGGGCLMNQGIHTVDLLRWLCGPVRRVFAQMRTVGHQHIDVEDVVAATVVFANGGVGTLMATTAAYPGFPARLAIYGTRGSAIIEGDVLQTLAIQGREPITGNSAAHHALQIAQGGTRSASAYATENRSLPPDDESAWGDAHRAQLQDFIRCCRTGERPIVDGQEGRAAVELVLAVYESARTGALVSL